MASAGPDWQNNAETATYKAYGGIALTDDNDRISSDLLDQLRRHNRFQLAGDPAEMADYVLRNARPGSIILLHVMYDGRIVRSGDKSLALELEEKGYTWLKKALVHA